MKADIGRIINESVTITKTRKKLWVFAFVILALSASGGSYNYSNFSNFFKSDTKDEINIDKTDRKEGYGAKLLAQNALTDIPSTLGESTNTFLEFLKGIPASLILIAIVSLTILFILGTAITLYAKAWASASLTHGISVYPSDPTLGQMSDFGKKKAIEVIKLTLIPNLIYVLLVLGLLLITLPVLLIKDAGPAILSIIWILVIPLIIIAGIILSVALNLGFYAVTLENMSWSDGFKRGFHVFFRYFIDVVVLGLINCFISCLVSIIGFIIGLTIGMFGLLTILGVVAFPPFLVVAGPIIFLLLLALLAISAIFGAGMVVFNRSTWTLLYKQVTEVNNG